MPSEHDDDEFCEFVSVNLVPLRRFGYLVCGDWQLAEDAVQTAFVKLYVTWSRANRASPKAYVRRMVLNALKDMHRRAWYRRERSTGDLPEPEPRNDHHLSDRRVEVARAMAQLPLRRRATLVLRYWEDKTVEETAEIMGCSANTVKSQTARGLRTLRGLLSDSILEQAEVTTR